MSMWKAAGLVVLGMALGPVVEGITCAMLPETRRGFTKWWYKTHPDDREEMEDILAECAAELSAENE